MPIIRLGPAKAKSPHMRGLFAISKVKLDNHFVFAADDDEADDG